LMKRLPLYATFTQDRDTNTGTGITARDMLRLFVLM